MKARNEHSSKSDFKYTSGLLEDKNRQQFVIMYRFMQALNSSHHNTGGQTRMRVSV
jgi:hypothetical protein